MSPTDYKSLLNETFMKIGAYVQLRDGAEIEIAKLKQLYYATLNMVPEKDRVEFQKQVDELASSSDEGLTEAIRSVLMAADGWMTTAMIRDKLKRVGFNFKKYDSNPLASIGTALRRWKAEEVETAQVEGVNAYRWKKSNMVPLFTLLKPQPPGFADEINSLLGAIQGLAGAQPLKGLTKDAPDKPSDPGLEGLGLGPDMEKHPPTLHPLRPDKKK